MNDTAAVPAPVEATELAQFDEFAAQLAEFKAKYEGVVYDLAVPAQNKQARSDRLAIGKVIANLDRRHSDVKAPLLAATRLVDGRRKEIKDDLLAVQTGIKDQIAAHEQAEADRLKELQERVEQIRDLVTFDPLDAVTSAVIAEELEKAEAVELGDDWRELKAQAALAKAETVALLRSMHGDALRHEADVLELERLRAAAEERERADRDERVRAEAEAKARQEAEEAAEQERQRVERERAKAQAKAIAERERLAKEQADAIAKNEREVKEAKKREQAAEQARIDAEQAAKLAAETAAREALEAAERAATAERERIEAEQRARAEKAKAEREAEEKRKAKRAHQGKIHRDAAASLVAGGFSEEVAKRIVEMIARGDVANLSVEY